MKIYLLNPPYVDKFSRGVRGIGNIGRGGTIYYPIWLAYATGNLEKFGFNTRLIDAPAINWNKTRVIDDILQFSPDLIVVESNFASLKNDISFSNELYALCNKNIIIVGPPCAQFAEHILMEKGIRIVARMEYDFTLVDLVRTLYNGGNLKWVKGISYKDNDCNLIHNPLREPSTSSDLDSLPFVSSIYKKHLIIKNYFLSSSLYPQVQIFTGRGCPHHCSFCSWPENMTGRKYRTRNIDSVVDELLYIKKELPQVKEVFFEDDTFTLDVKRVNQLCQQISKMNLKTTWSCNARADIDYETMVAMKKAGCRLIVIGYESGSDEILSNIQKGNNIEKMLSFTKMAKKAKLLVHGDFIFGLPGETLATAKETLKFIKQIRPNILQIELAQPIPGTAFFDWANKNHYIFSDEYPKIENYQNYAVSYPEFAYRDMKYFANCSLKQYYLNISYIPVAFQNILEGNGLQEMMLMLRASRRFFQFIHK